MSQFVPHKSMVCVGRPYNAVVKKTGLESNSGLTTISSGYFEQTAVSLSLLCQVKLHRATGTKLCHNFPIPKCLLCAPATLESTLQVLSHLIFMPTLHAKTPPNKFMTGPGFIHICHPVEAALIFLHTTWLNVSTQELPFWYYNYSMAPGMKSSII